MALSTDRANLQIGQIAEVYARSLFDLAKQADRLDDVRDELSQILQILRDQPTLARVFENQTIRPQRRGESIRRIFSDHVNDLTLRFLLVVNHKGRLPYLPHIHAAFDKQVKDHRGQVDVNVYTARTLDESKLDEVARQLTSAIGRTAIVHPHTDESLIGGVKVRYEDRLIDASIASRLKQLRRHLDRGGGRALHRAAERMLEEATVETGTSQ